MNKNTVGEWRIHVGAHKTASTHLQNDLENKVGELIEKGIDYLPREISRPLLCFSPFGPRAKVAAFMPIFSKITLNRPALDIREEILAQCTSRERILLSEESLLGEFFPIFDKLLYPNLQRLQIVKYLTNREPLKIFITVRSFDSWLPSAYSEALKDKQMVRHQLRDAIQYCMTGEISWVTLLDRIQRTLPSAEINVINYDDYQRKSGEIQKFLKGCNLSHNDELEAPVRTRRPSEKAIQMAESLELSHRTQRPKVVRDIFTNDSLSDDYEIFDPLGLHEKDVLRNLFERDLSQISQKYFLF